MFKCSGIMFLIFIMLFSIDLMAADGDLVWAKQAGGIGSDFGYGIIIWNSYVLTTGAFSGTADFDPGGGTINLTSAGASDAYMWTLDNSGNYVWAGRFGGSEDDFCMEIDLDSDNNVYLTGWFRNTVDFDLGSGTSTLTSAGLFDIYAVKYDITGALIWAKSFGGPGDDQGYGIAVNSESDVYLSGSFSGTGDFNPGNGTFNLTSQGGFDIYMVKLNSDGDFVWANAMGGPGNDQTWSMSLDSAGNPHITGTFSNTADFDPDAGVSNLVSQGGTDIFAAKYNSPGNHVWSHSMGGPDDDVGRTIEVDSSTNSCTAGYFKGTADFDPSSGSVIATSKGGYDVFIWKLGSSGSLIWGKSVGGTGDDYVYGVTYDLAGNVFTTGSFTNTVDFDPGNGTANLTSTGNQDVFISKLDTNGNYVWAKKIGGADSDVGIGITADGAGAVYATGEFRGTADFDPGSGTLNLTSSGQSDSFVIKLAAPPDTIPPNATIINPSTLGPTADTSITFEVIFDEYVTNFNNISDLVITYTETVASTGVTITGSDYRYFVTVSGITGDGTISLAVSTASDVVDLAGHPLASSITSPAVIIDHTPPPNAITIWPSTLGPTSETSLSFTVIFDYPVIGFDNVSDVILNLTGDVSYSAITIQGNGNWYRVNLTGISGTGTATMKVDTGSDVTNLRGTPLESSVTSAIVYIDPNAPALPLVLWPLGLAFGIAGVAMLNNSKKRQKSNK